MAQKNNLQDTIVDLVKALKPALKRHSRYSRTEAWERLTSKKGQEEMKKVLQDPDRPLNTFKQLSFKEWLTEQ